VAAKVRERVAETGESKRIGRTAGEVRKLFESLTGTAEDPGVASFATLLVDYIRGTATDEQMVDALHRLVRGEVIERECVCAS
jgi:hypothetical protein